MISAFEGRTKVDIVMRFALPLVLSVVATFLRFRENHGEPTSQLHYQRAYTRFFPENATSVIDYYDGNLYHFDKHENEDCLVVFSYAKWDERSSRTRNEYARVAALLSKRVTFTAIDCGNAQGNCGRTRHMESFPQVDFRLPHLQSLLTSLRLRDAFAITTGIYADQLYAEIDNLRRPLTRLTTYGDVLRFAAENDNALIGHFDSTALTYGAVDAKAYSHFYVTALRFISGYDNSERDASVRTAIVTDRHVAAAFNLTNNGDLIYADYYGFYKITSQMWSANATMLINLVSRAYRAPMVEVLVPRDYPTRSLQLVSRLRNTTVVLVLVTKIRPLERSNQPEIAAMRELAFEMNNCRGAHAASFFDIIPDEESTDTTTSSSRSSGRFDKLLDHLRSARDRYHRERSNVRRLCAVYKSELQAFIDRSTQDVGGQLGHDESVWHARCSSARRCVHSTINATLFNMAVGQADELRIHEAEMELQIRANEAAEQLAELERQFNAQEFDATRFGYDDARVSQAELPADPHVRSVRSNFFKRLCEEAALSDQRKSGVADADDAEATASDKDAFAEVRGLACSWNRTMQFLVVDADRHSSFADRFDVGGDGGARALLLDFEDDSYFTMRNAFSGPNLAAFVRDFVYSKLTRSWRSTPPQRIEKQHNQVPSPATSPNTSFVPEGKQSLANVEADGLEIDVTDWSSRDLIAALKDRKEANLVVMYHSAACGASRTLATAFLGLRHLLELFGLSQLVLLGRIDLSVNELPIRLQIPAVPSVVLFVGRLDDNRARLRASHFNYDTREPVLLDDLFRFVLAHGRLGSSPSSATSRYMAAYRPGVRQRRIKAGKRTARPKRVPNATNRQLVTMLGNVAHPIGHGKPRFIELLNIFRKLFAETWCHSVNCYSSYETTMRRLVAENERDRLQHIEQLAKLNDRIARLTTVLGKRSGIGLLDQQAIGNLVRGLSSKLLALRRERALFGALRSYFLHEVVRIKTKEHKSASPSDLDRHASLLALTRCIWHVWIAL